MRSVSELALGLTCLQGQQPKPGRDRAIDVSESMSASVCPELSPCPATCLDLIEFYAQFALLCYLIAGGPEPRGIHA